jgi:1,4-alpha-glucan branching enzyme
MLWLLIIHTQGDAEFLRYRGMQEFDQAMQHLEETHGVSFVVAEILSRTSVAEVLIKFQKNY